MLSKECLLVMVKHWMSHSKAQPVSWRPSTVWPIDGLKEMIAQMVRLFRLAAQRRHQGYGGVSDLVENLLNPLVASSFLQCS